MDRLPELEALAQSFLTAMDLSLSMAVTEREDSILIELQGEDAHLLTEREGAVLDALQLLLGKVAESRVGLQKRLVIDCEGFRHDRESELVELAKSAAKRVLASGQAEEVGPFNSYERRLVHLALQDEAGVKTESQGEGFIKTILIRPT